MCFSRFTGILGLGLLLIVPALPAGAEDAVTYRGQTYSDPETLERLQLQAQESQYNFALGAPFPQSDDELQALLEEVWPNVSATLKDRATERTGLVYNRGAECEAPASGATADHERFFTCLLEQDEALEALDAEIRAGRVEMFEQAVIPWLRAAFGPEMETLQGRLDWAASDEETRKQSWLRYIAGLPAEEAKAVTAEFLIFRQLHTFAHNWRGDEKARLLQMAHAAIDNVPADDPFASRGRFAFFERYAPLFGARGADPAVVAKMDALTPQIRGLKEYYEEVARCGRSYGNDGIEKIRWRIQCLEDLREPIQQATQPVRRLAATYPGHFTGPDYDAYLESVRGVPIWLLNDFISDKVLYLLDFLEEQTFAETVAEDPGRIIIPAFLAAALESLPERYIEDANRTLTEDIDRLERKRQRAAMAMDELYGGKEWALGRREEQAEFLRRERAIRNDGFPDIDCDTWLEDGVSGSAESINDEFQEFRNCVNTLITKRVDQYNELLDFYNSSEYLTTNLHDYDGSTVQDIRARLEEMRSAVESEKQRALSQGDRIIDNIRAEGRRRAKANRSSPDPTYSDIMRGFNQMKRCNAAFSRQLACVSAGGINCPMPPGC